MSLRPARSSCSPVEAEIDIGTDSRLCAWRWAVTTISWTVADPGGVAAAEARGPDRRFPLRENFVQQLTGARITSLTRRAKYLLARLDREDTLVMHLGMSGRFEIARPEGTERPGEFHYAPDPDPKHAHIV